MSTVFSMAFFWMLCPGSFFCNNFYLWKGTIRTEPFKLKRKFSSREPFLTVSTPLYTRQGFACLVLNVQGTCLLWSCHCFAICVEQVFEDYSSVPTISDDYYISDCIWNKKKDMRHISSMIAKKQILYINFMGTDIYIYIDHYHIFLNSLMTMIFSTLTDGCVSLEIYFL